MTDTDEPDLDEVAAQALKAISPRALARLGKNPAEALRPLVDAILDEAKAKAWIKDQLDATRIHAMELREGSAELSMEAASESMAFQFAAAKTMLGDATNYSETIAWDLSPAGKAEKFTIVVQRHALNALTPHEARVAAETRAQELEEANLEAAARAQETIDRLRAEVAGRTEPDGCTEDREYQVVGDWGTNGAEDEEQARRFARRALREYPGCGARVEWRVARMWDDGAEYYGPWNDLETGEPE